MLDDRLRIVNLRPLVSRIVNYVANRDCPVLELIMACQTTHPTKEQVRAYMAAREAARRPPPPPEEIRRQLGWRLVSEDEQSLVRFCMIPSTYAQLVARLALQWMFAPVRHATCPPESK